MPKWFSLILFLIGTPLLAEEIQPYWSEPVSLARMLIFPLALEFADRTEHPSYYKITITPDTGVHFRGPQIDFWLRSSDEVAQARFVRASVILSRMLINASYVKLDVGEFPRFEIGSNAPADLILNLRPPRSMRSTDVQRWITDSELDLQNRYPFLKNLSKLVVADFLLAGDRAISPTRKSLFEELTTRSEDPTLGGPTAWAPIDLRLKLFGLSLFTPRGRYADRLRDLLERPSTCSEFLEDSD